MRLATRLRATGFAVTCVYVAAVPFVLATNLPTVVLSLGALVGYASWVIWRRVALRRAARAMAAAFERGDTSEARRLLDELTDCFPRSPRVLAALRTTEAAILLQEERLVEAKALLESIDRRGLPPTTHAILLNNLGYAKALSGEPEEAISILISALAMCPAKTPPRTRQMIQGSLAIAHICAGDHAPGVSALRMLVAPGSTASASRTAQCVRWYFLGEGLRAMGKDDDAIAAYSNAVRELPKSGWAARARQRIGAPPFR